MKTEENLQRHPSAIRLLVVDDDPDVLEVVMQQMEAAGYSVSIAESGAGALELLDADASVELIVSDLSMPGMDGVQLIQQAQERHPQLPVIFLTGLADSGTEIALGRVITGPFAVVHKPINAEQLANRVAKLLRGSNPTGPRAG
jgi:CheY-like chemotaxis protein